MLVPEIFSLFKDSNYNRIEDEHFYLSVNMTTGFIEFLMGPRITIANLKAYKRRSLITKEQFQSTLKNIDIILKWAHEYDEVETSEKFIYSLAEKKSQKKIACINAETGEIICYS